MIAYIATNNQQLFITICMLQETNAKPHDIIRMNDFNNNNENINSNLFLRTCNHKISYIVPLLVDRLPNAAKLTGTPLGSAVRTNVREFIRSVNSIPFK